jgi:hypothetical protein
MSVVSILHNNNTAVSSCSRYSNTCFDFEMVFGVTYIFMLYVLHEKEVKLTWIVRAHSLNLTKVGSWKNIRCKK